MENLVGGLAPKHNSSGLAPQGGSHRAAPLVCQTRKRKGMLTATWSGAPSSPCLALVIQSRRLPRRSSSRVKETRLCQDH
jgi:hypothetical protein